MWSISYQSVGVSLLGRETGGTKNLYDRDFLTMNFKYYGLFAMNTTMIIYIQV